MNTYPNVVKTDEGLKITFALQLLFKLDMIRVWAYELISQSFVDGTDYKSITLEHCINRGREHVIATLQGKTLEKVLEDQNFSSQLAEIFPAIKEEYESYENPKSKC